jgi:hypothetical protein
MATRRHDCGLRTARAAEIRTPEQKKKKKKKKKQRPPDDKVQKGGYTVRLWPSFLKNWVNTTLKIIKLNCEYFFSLKGMDLTLQRRMPTTTTFWRNCLGTDNKLGEDVGYFMGTHPNHFKNFRFLVYTIILHQLWLQEGIPGPKLP